MPERAPTLAGMEPNAQAIKASIDLVEYLSSLGIELAVAGTGGEYRGLCPFHKESTPSFQVNRRKGLWHCFGCGAGGDVISFVMRREGIGFREALRLLSNPGRSEAADILAAAAGYWHGCLAGSRSAQGYLARRGIGTPGIIEQYRIGFAPGAAKTRHKLISDGFSEGEIRAAGLVNRKGLDMFFGRATFPLVEDGRTVNVYGRSLSDSYRHMYLPGRRDVIFNLENVRGENAILTEGAIDALSLAALGFENAVSSLSANLTPRQVEILAVRFSRITIAFDGDDGGRAGARAAAAALESRGVNVRLAVLPEGSDLNALLMAGVSRREMELLVQGEEAP